MAEDDPVRERALDALFGCVIDDQGTRWGEVATDRQCEAAEAPHCP